MNDEVIILRHQNAALHLLRYGATIHRFIVNGRDLVAGPENHEDYRKSRTFQNVIIGRYSSRLPSDPIQLANGIGLKLQPNEGTTVLHGGETSGFDQQDWDTVSRGSSTLFPSDDDDFPVHCDDATEAILCLDLVDGEQGFPHALHCEALYQLRTNRDGLPELLVAFRAIMTDSVAGDITPINMTQHTGYTLCDYSSGEDESVKNHLFHVKVGTLDDNEVKIPIHLATGRVRKIEDHPIGLHKFSQQAHPLSECIEKGIDDNLILDRHQPDDVVATLENASTGLKLTFRTNQSSVVCFGANNFHEGYGLRKSIHQTQTGSSQGYPKHGCLFLEFQHPTATFLHPDLQVAAGTDTLLRHGGIYENWHTVACQM